ncbi:hypothetical protein PUMCH_003404 [Australozyma saopauloensis]|uniref:Peroxin/Ferlin domain-containing protein n=1 Tax=Australozyma saopauloensis TaxID=291208 RepID=A0AAX4HCP9_9ASCO|nr:hypothetical protein PUMCH_003404 [[Candida] saopauloensis]
MSEPEPVPNPTEFLPLATSSDGDLRANFSDGNPITAPEEKVQPQTLPLLSLTPPSVAKALIRAYPYLLIVNKTLSVATWTNDDYWVNAVIMCLYTFVVLYFETLMTWLGHLILVAVVVMYSVLNNKIMEETNLRPTLDDVIQALSTTCIKADILLTPVTTMALTAYDIKRLLFTTVFLTPVYLIVTFLLIPPRTILLFLGLFLLLYHLSFMRVTRRMLWKLKVARILCFYLTGLDFSQARNSSLFAAAFAKVQKAGTGLPRLGGFSSPVRFTYVIYENQRRWLGIGWTLNLLTYERAPWTDEFLNESSSLDHFELPNADNSLSSVLHPAAGDEPSLGSARWRWVDKTWRLDLTNDGAITLAPGKRSKTTVQPTSDEGFIFTDNVWKKPSTEDSYSKYTRRRRWIRTAELVFNSTVGNASTVNEATSIGETSPSAARRRKSLRFADDDEDVASASGISKALEVALEED